MPKVLSEIDPNPTEILPQSNPIFTPTQILSQPEACPNPSLHLGLEKKVDLRRINLDALKPWIADRIARLVTEEVGSFPYFCLILGWVQFFI